MCVCMCVCLCVCVFVRDPDGVTVGLSGCGFLPESELSAKRKSRSQGHSRVWAGGLTGHTCPCDHMSPIRVSVACPLGLRSQLLATDRGCISALEEPDCVETGSRKQPAGPAGVAQWWTVSL